MKYWTVAEEFALEDRLSGLTGQVNACTAALVAELVPVVRDETWAAPGLRSVEHYVCWQTGANPARARRLVTIAKRWDDLPSCRDLFVAGSIGEDAMGLIARTLPSERDAEVAAMAPLMTFSQLATLISTRPKDPAPKPARKPETSFWDDPDLGFMLRTNADHDEGALLRRALEAARNDLFHLRNPNSTRTEAPLGAVAWHDAFLHLAEVGLNAFDPSVQRGGRASDRHQVHLHLDVRDADHDRIASLHLGPVIRSTLARYLSCDATISAVLWDGHRLLGVSPRERTVNDRLRTAIEQRDKGCRVPGCTQRRWLHVHHIVHWEDGGPTVPSNLCCVCPHHHRLHHAGLLRIEGDPETPDGLKIFDHQGRPLRPPPPTPPPPGTPPTAAAFTRPIGEKVDWHSWWWLDLPSTPN